MKKFLAAGALSLALLIPLRAEVPETKPAEKVSFTRFVEDESGGRLQTGVRSYRNKDGVAVDLIGAIHIADKAYYKKLNARFTRYDAMLYEMVGESYATRKRWQAEAEQLSKEDTDVMKKESTEGENLRWLHPLYETMEKSLGLSGQLNGIDYGAPNFVHADMTMRQFAATQRRKNESFLSLWWKSVVVQLDHPEAAPEQPSLLKIMEILCRKDSKTELKRIMGRMFGSVDDMLSGMEVDGGSVIISERNRVALSVLAKQIALGRKNLAIFYGAAHLIDMDKRLRAMGFEQVGSEWFTAWDLPPPPPEEPAGASVQK
jgi:hypothetical protein